MGQSLSHDVLILGAGLAGLRAAVEIARRSNGRDRYRHRLEGPAHARPLGLCRGRDRGDAADR